MIAIRNDPLDTEGERRFVEIEKMLEIRSRVQDAQ
jgi:hypothetical protein